MRPEVSGTADALAGASETKQRRQAQQKLGYQKSDGCSKVFCDMITQPHRKELIQALRALVHKVCCEPEGPWGKVRVVESLPVCVPMPEVLVKFVGSTTNSQL